MSPLESLQSLPIPSPARPRIFARRLQAEAPAAASAPLDPSRRIAGYVLSDLMASTPHGETWRAWNAMQGRIFVIKIFKAQPGEAWASLSRELSTLSQRFKRLESSPFVNPFLELKLTAATPHGVMEQLDGGSLKDMVQAGKPSSLRKALPWLQQMAEALAVLHADGIFHGNLKPSNALLDTRGRVRLADFGQLNLKAATSQGTLGYVSPEFLAAATAGVPAHADARGDIYSLGACFYALLAGEAPRARPRKPAEIRQETGRVLDEDLAAILGKCLQPDPKQRYASASALLEDLKAREQQKPVSPLADQGAYLARKFLRRHRSSLAAGALALAGLGTAAFQGYQNNQLLKRQLAYSFVLRAQQYAERKDPASAAACYAKLNSLYPSDLARANALGFLSGMENAEAVIDPALGINAAAMSPDGKILATAGRDGSAELWSLDGRKLGMPLRHDDGVQSLAFSPNGARLLTGSLDKNARLWDLKTGRLIGKPLPLPTGVNQVAFSPDGRLFMTRGNEAKIRLWDAATARALPASIDPPSPATGTLFSPEGSSLLVWGADKTARLYRVRDGALLGQAAQQSGEIFAAAFSPDGKLVALACADGFTRLWNPRGGGAALRSFSQGNQVKAVAFSPDGRHLATGGGDRCARLWDLATGAALGRPMEHQGWVVDLAFSPDGSQILTGSLDKSAQLWNAASGEPEGGAMQHAWAVLGAHFAPDAKHVWTRCADGTLHVFARAAKPRASAAFHSPAAWSAAYAIAPDGKSAAAGAYSGACTLWNLESGAEIQLVPGHTAWVTSAAFSADGALLATASMDKSVRLWNAVSGKPLGVPLHHDCEVMRVAFSPGGKGLVSVGKDMKTRFWSLEGRELSSLQHGAPVSSLAFSPDGAKLLVATEDNFSRLYDVASGAALGKPMGHEGHVTLVGFSPDGKSMLSVGVDNCVRLWSAANCEALGPPLREASPIMGARFSPDGKLVAIHCDGGTVSLREAATGLQRGKLMRQEWGIGALAFSPDGKFLATGTYNGEVQLWESASGESVGALMRAGGPVDALQFSSDMNHLLGSSRSVNKLADWDLSWLAEKPKPAALLARAEHASFLHFGPDGSLLPLSPPEWRSMGGL